MAATIDLLASAVLGTPGTTYSTAAGQSWTAGDFMVALVAASNDGSGGAASLSSVTHNFGGGPTMSQMALINYDPGAAGAGATLGIFGGLCPDSSSATFSVGFGLTTTSQSSVRLVRIRPGPGETISLVGVDTTGVTGNSTSHNAATVEVNDGDIMIAAAAVETDDTLTGDSDTTNGNWSAIDTVLDDQGADASTMSLSWQYKTVNATGNQDWACTTATGRDSARTYVVFRSVPIVPVHMPLYIPARW